MEYGIQLINFIYIIRTYVYSVRQQPSSDKKYIIIDQIFCHLIIVISDSIESYIAF